MIGRLNFTAWPCVVTYDGDYGVYENGLNTFNDLEHEGVEFESDAQEEEWEELC